MNILKRGSKGDEVKMLQQKLGVATDGVFGSDTEKAVKEFQAKNGLIADGIVGAKTWTALGVDSAPNTRLINKIIVHCSATPEGKDYTVDQIRQWHLARGFNDIGYHYVIYRDGSIHRGRAEHLVGAHTTGYNANSIGICYIGGVAADGKTPKDTRTKEQKEALVKLLKELKSKYIVATIHGHREFANKACPSFDAKSEYKNI